MNLKAGAPPAESGLRRRRSRPRQYSRYIYKPLRILPAAPKALQAENPPPIGRNRKVSARPVGAGKRPTGIGRPGLGSASARRRGRGWPPIRRRGKDARKRACRIGVGSQASYPPRSDEGPGNRDSQKRTPSLLRGISIQHCAEQAGSESQGVGLLPHYFSAGFIN